jgi:hypothetical protein
MLVKAIQDVFIVIMLQDITVEMQQTKLLEPVEI